MSEPETVKDVVAEIKCREKAFREGCGEDRRALGDK